MSNQYGERNLRVKETDGRLVVIRNCHRTTVRLPEGTRHVTLESCTSVSLLVHGVADSVDVVNSRGIKLVCRGPVAAIDIESSFGVRITLRSVCLFRSRVLRCKVKYEVMRACCGRVCDL